MSPHTHVPRFTFVAAALLCVTAGCGRNESATIDSAAGAAVPTDTAPATPALNDAQIAHIAVTANTIDSTVGVLARTNGSSRAVKDFALTMIRDHGAVNKQAVELATKLNVTPEDNETSRQLQSGADQTRQTLSGMTGAAFDSAYISHEVEFHQTVLDALDNTLIPGAQNAELKALLEKVRPNFAAHLERAKSIQGSLGTTS
jgi:putative membrane protein